MEVSRGHLGLIEEVGGGYLHLRRKVWGGDLRLCEVSGGHLGLGELKGGSLGLQSEVRRGYLTHVRGRILGRIYMRRGHLEKTNV